jgi:hypothetical protein
VIQRDEDQLQLVCDVCGDESPSYDADSFETMLSDVKSDGWVIIRKDGHWHHECKSCGKEGSALAAARKRFGLG